MPRSGFLRITCLALRHQCQQPRRRLPCLVCRISPRPACAGTSKPGGGGGGGGGIGRAARGEVYRPRLAELLRNGSSIGAGRGQEGHSRRGDRKARQPQGLPGQLVDPGAQITARRVLVGARGLAWGRRVFADLRVFYECCPACGVTLCWGGRGLSERDFATPPPHRDGQVWFRIAHTVVD